jgi:hypothetical protein
MNRHGCPDNVSPQWLCASCGADFGADKFFSPPSSVEKTCIPKIQHPAHAQSTGTNIAGAKHFMDSQHTSQDGNWQSQYEKSVSDLMNLLEAEANLKLEIELQAVLVQLLSELNKPP